MRRISGLFTLALAVAVVSGCSFLPSAASAFPAATPSGTQSNLAVGVYESGVPQSWSLLSEFTKVTAVSPKFVVYYSGWNERFKSDFAATVRAHGATVFVKMQPTTVSLASIAAGDSDSYLRKFALAVAAFKSPVIISFAHEMNGTWYPWGYGHATPAQFVAAWKRVVLIFRAEGASNAIWVWTVNSTNVAQGDLLRWWPGGEYVSWVGVDGYFGNSNDTFTSVFGETINQLRAFSGKPVMIAETSVDRSLPDRENLIYSLFAGARYQKVIGIVWFDAAHAQGSDGKDWRLEGDPDAIAAFKKAVHG